MGEKDSCILLILGRMWRIRQCPYGLQWDKHGWYLSTVPNVFPEATDWCRSWEGVWIIPQQTPHGSKWKLLLLNFWSFFSSIPTPDYSFFVTQFHLNKHIIVFYEAVFLHNFPSPNYCLLSSIVSECSFDSQRNDTLDNTLILKSLKRFSSRLLAILSGIFLPFFQA